MRLHDAPDRAAPPPPFAVYGEGGDHVGARRLRHSFRMAVIGAFGLAVALWLAENYLRYDLSETQYRMSLTLHDDSARAVLRNVVRRGSESGRAPNPQYVEALAFIEEEDVILARYEEAYKLNPSNSFLLIKYGCALFAAGQYEAARERFREAGAQPPRNALPRYLEAAARAAASPDGLAEALVLIERTNMTGERVVFPRPLWHPSLPVDGAAYVRMQRRIADACLAPLYRFKDALTARARQEATPANAAEWEDWLGALQAMGGRIAGDAATKDEDAGAVPVEAGVAFERDAVAQRMRLREMRQAAPDPALAARAAALERARDAVAGFQNAREGRMAAHRRAIGAPLSLAFRTLAYGAMAFLAAYLVAEALGARRAYWAAPHPALGKALLAAAGACFLALLLAASALHTLGPGGGALRPAFDRVWAAGFLILAGFGPFYPALALAPAHLAAERAAAAGGGDPAALIPAARRSRRRAYGALMRRYFGVIAGGAVIAVCAWLVCYRVVFGLYPWPTEMLETGLRPDELALVRQVQGWLAR